MNYGLDPTSMSLTYSFL